MKIDLKGHLDLITGGSSQLGRVLYRTLGGLRGICSQ
jgi:hypothetical protein